MLEGLDFESALKELQQMMSSSNSSQSPQQMLASALMDRSIPPQLEYDPEEQLKNAKALYDSIQKRKGKKTPYFPDYQIIASHRMQREASMKNNDGYVKTVNSNIFDIYHSKATGLDQLKPIFINDLLMETWHEGRYLLCRTIEMPYRLNSIMSIVEDETGRISLLALYNYTKHITDNPDPYLPVNTILAIKEPYFKATSNGGAMIRCDSPSDVIIINYRDNNYEKLRVSTIRNWEKLCSSVDRLHKAPVPKSPKEWRSRGNELYKNGFLNDAVRAYSLGLSLCQDKFGSVEEEKELLTLNRSAAYLTWGRFDAAANDAVTVLEIKPSNVKALSRAARAYYQLRNYDLSLKYFERLFGLDSSCEKELIMCRQRLKEESKGDYDWGMLRKLARPVRLDVADYINRDAIEITFISKEKGRGVIAKRDIPPGTVLIVCKAFVISFAEEVKTLFMITTNLKRQRCLSSSQVQLIIAIMHKLLECPSTGEKLYQLWSGKGEKGQVGRNVTDNCKEGSEIIDYDEIDRICRYNSFCRDKAYVNEEKTKLKPFGSPVENPLSETMSQFTSGSGLWINSSFFNHSCIPNTYLWFAGDVMVLVSNRFVRKGEELTVAYAATGNPLSKRRETLLNYGISCKCPLCICQSELNFNDLSVLMKTFEADISPRILNYDSSVIPKLEKLIENMKKIYERNNQSRFLFELIGPMSGLALLYQMKGKIKESVQIYEQIFQNFSNIKDIDSYLRGSGKKSKNGDEESGNCLKEQVHFSNGIFHVVEHLVRGYREIGNFKVSAKWAALLIMFEGFQGFDEKAARQKHSDIL